ncbi:hypothetical protein BH23BAC3_BH23BAC3_02810 [soil metagenome]
MYRHFLNIIKIKVVILLLPALVTAQNSDLKVLDWKPKSQLVLGETEILKPKYPVIDIHNHLRDLSRLEHYIQQMDEAGVWMTVSLDGRSANDFYKEHLEAAKKVSEERLIVFFTPDFSKIDEPDFAVKEAEKLEEAVRMGARGMKIFKALGLTIRDASGEIIRVDDPRIDPIWKKCGELGIPVLIHVSDPKAFFDPLDELNERHHDLMNNPDWSFYGDEFPDKEDILNQRNNVFRKHPNTTFIATHMANLPEDLGRVSMWLQTYPNMYVDINARISELGRQPYTARKFMIQHQDRILFGTDTRPNADAYRMHYRFLETDDEYFDPAPSHGPMERWMIYGLYLPDQILEKIYNKNALKIFSQLKGI